MTPNPAARQSLLARAHYLKHPDASISQTARATGVGTRTVARVRKELVNEGLLVAGRNAPPGPLTVLPPVTPPEGEALPPQDAIGTTESGEEAPEEPKRPRGRPRKDSNSLLDDAAMRELAGMLDVLADSDDVEATRRRLLKQTQRFVFDPTLHADTRMSASTLWTKLVDMARAKDLGPGKPLTLADAIARATDFCSAAGAAVMVPAFYAAFNLADQSTASAQPQAVTEMVVETRPVEVPRETPEVQPTAPPSPVLPPPTLASPWG